MKNSAMDSTSEILNADQVSMCRSCSRARRGPRPALPPFPRAGRALTRAPVGTADVAPVTGPGARPGPEPGGGTGGAASGEPAGPPEPGAVSGADGLCARIPPVVGIDWVAET